MAAMHDIHFDVHIDLLWKEEERKLLLRSYSFVILDDYTVKKTWLRADPHEPIIGDATTPENVETCTIMQAEGAPFERIVGHFQWPKWVQVEEPSWLELWGQICLTNKDKSSRANAMLFRINSDTYNAVQSEVERLGHWEKEDKERATEQRELLKGYSGVQQSKDEPWYIREVQRDLFSQVRTEIETWMYNHRFKPPGESEPSPPTSEKQAIKGSNSKEDREFLQSLTKKRNLISQFVRCCELQDTAEPTLDMLSEISGSSKSAWSKKLSDPIFLAALLKEIGKKINQGKTENSKRFWAEANASVDSKIRKVSDKLYKQKRTSYWENSDPTDSNSEGDG